MLRKVIILAAGFGAVLALSGCVSPYYYRQGYYEDGYYGRSADAYDGYYRPYRGGNYRNSDDYGRGGDGYYGGGYGYNRGGGQDGSYDYYGRY